MRPEELFQAGFDFSGESYDRLERLVLALLAANERVNLTGARTAVQLWGAHICDGLALLPRLDAHGGESLIDVGTGGGLPGLIVACCRPALRVTLLDATRKKVTAIAELARLLELRNVETVWGRAEVWGRGPGAGRFELATARAVATLDTLLGYLGPLLKSGGRAWLYKSIQAVEREVKEAATAAARQHLRLVGVERYSLPAGFGERAFAVYEKSGPCASP